MSKAGGYKQREPGTLKEAQAALVEACGGLQHAAHLTRVSKSQIARYTDPAAADCHMPADVIRALEMHCGDQVVTRFLALQEGSVLVRLPKDGSHKSYMKHLAAIGHETGEFYANACDAVADGTLSPKERATVRAKVIKTITALSALLSDLNAMGEKP